MKFAISDVESKNDGMFVHHKSIVRILNKLGDVTIIQDSRKYSTGYFDSFDYVLRYGWPSNISNKYSDAIFSYNISSAKDKNILIAPFNMLMLPHNAIDDIKANFSKVIYDSSYSQEFGDQVLGGLVSTRINPLVDFPLNRVRYSNKVKQNTYNFLHISNSLYWIKGVDLIVKAFLESFDKNENVCLNLILKDYDNEFLRLKSMFKVLDRGHQIKLYENSIPHNKMHLVYKISDCYVCSSRYETFSLPTLESAYLGLKIIAHDKGGMRDYLSCLNKNQLLPVRTKKIKISKDVWRGNEETYSYEPILLSLKKALIKAYGDGKNNKEINKKIVKIFSEDSIGVKTMSEFLQ